MITAHDLDSAIAECHGKPHPDAKTCIMLAAFYTIKREMLGEGKDAELAYSFASAPEVTTGIDYPGESEFAQAIRGQEPDKVWEVVDELVSTIQVIQPRLYYAFMRKVQG